MNPGIEMFAPNKVKENKRVRAFVRGDINKYGECSERSLTNAKKSGGNVKMTFTHYKVTGKEATVIKIVDQYIPIQDIK